ncbi:MAG: GGDEF domain-containing protein [Pseudomonadota bacterium]
MQATILAFMLPAMMLVFAGLFFALWWPVRSRKYVLAYAVCFGLLGSATVLNLFVFGRADLISVVIYHLISMSGVMALMWAVCQRSGVQMPLAMIGFSIVVASALIGAAFAFGNFDLARLAQNIHSSVLFGIVGLAAWQGKKRFLADRLTIGTLALFCFAGFILPFAHNIVHFHFGDVSEQARIVSTVHFIILGTLMFALGGSLVSGVVQDNMKRQSEEAMLDRLTGLPNRAAFEPLAKKMMSRSVVERVPVCMIVCDIDHFKEVNDAFGHKIGDNVISAFGEMLSGRTRPGDIAGRIGGEEFCIIAWNCSEKGACALAERLRIAFATEEFPFLPDSETTSASFGIAQANYGDTYSKMFERADAALYRAKKSGRNRVVGDEIGMYSRALEAVAEQGDGNGANGDVINLPKRPLTSTK